MAVTRVMPVALVENGANFRRKDCVDLLIKARVHLECRDIWQRTPLLKAVVNHHYTIASMLMVAGASVNAADDDKKVPLHVAASYGNSRGVNELLECGGDIDFQDLNGRTALYFALGSQGKTPPDAFEILNLTITAHGLVPGQQLMSSALTQYKKQPNGDMRLVIHRLILAGGVVKVPDSGK
ncbi:ankyrin repeat domain-containing protein 23-like [Liolophura sinensis]|uniref:ankyrin repeat domain-containing protein 23-like n=1 Tax=Liolophura sinensis TaxID=3198878 RepID=UPI003158A4DD